MTIRIGISCTTRALVISAAIAVGLAIQPAIAQSTCTMSSGGSIALGVNSFACGPNAVLQGSGGAGNPLNPVRGTALGDTAQVVGNDGTAVGQYSYASTSYQ
jgi:trimeric autotransporter adhesin